MPTTQKERQDFVDKMNTVLVLNDYGFTPSKHPKPPGSGFITYDNVDKIKAIRELNVRMKLFVATGRYDHGNIAYPEANRRIDYNFNGDAIGKCSVKLVALSNENPLIFR